MKLLLITLLQENAFISPADLIQDSLILRIGESDKEAFHELYEKTKKAVYGFAYSIVKNPQDAQDIVQDTFIKVYDAAPNYKPQNKPMAWIFTIARNLALMKIRNQNKTIAIEEQEGLENLFQVSPQTTSEHTYILQNALSKLSEESRQIVVLHALSGMLHKEIAEVLNLNLSTVLSKYNRALKKLREIIEEDNKDEY